MTDSNGRVGDDSLHERPWWWAYPSAITTVVVLVSMALVAIWIMMEVGLV